MNEFITTDQGGLPLRSDDFRFFQNAYRDAFKGLSTPLHAVHDKIIVLTGCSWVTSSGSTVFNDGVVAFDGELWNVEETTNSEFIFPNAAYWDFDIEMMSPDGEKEFQSGVVYQTYQKRTARIVVVEDSSAVPPGKKIYFDWSTGLYEDTLTYFEALQYNMDTVPVGSIMLWSGNSANIPNGWALAAGQPIQPGLNAPDLRERFVIGVNPSGSAPFNVSGSVIQTNIASGSGVYFYTLCYIVKMSTNLPPLGTF